MDKVSLKERVVKLINSYESGELYDKIRDWVPNAIGKRQIVAFNISSGAHQDTADRDLDKNLLFWYQDNDALGVGKGLKTIEFYADEKGDCECSFCGGRTNNKYTVSMGFLSKDTYYFCFVCERNLNKKYSFSFWDSDNKFYDFGYSDYNWCKGRKIIVDDIFGRGNLIEDINNNFTSLQNEYSSLKNKRVQEFEDIVTRMEYEILNGSKLIEKQIKAEKEKEEERAAKEEKRIKALQNSIINLLKEKAVKMPASDIDAHLKYKNVDEIKGLCEEMYHNGEISRTGNYRYFILTEEKKKRKDTGKPKKTTAAKTEEVDIEKELEKYKRMLDKDLITEEEYEAKKKEFLGSPTSPKSIAKSTENIVSNPKSKKVSLESVKKDEIEESKTEKSSADSSDDPIESFRSFISSSFKNIKNPKGKPYGICPIGSGIELDFYVKKSCVAVYLYSNGKVNAESLIKKINDSGITGKVLNDKYTLEPMSGKRNPEVVRIDINIMYEGRELNSKEMRDEVKDIYGQMLFLCKNLV